MGKRTTICKPNKSQTSIILISKICIRSVKENHLYMSVNRTLKHILILTCQYPMDTNRNHLSQFVKNFQPLS